MRRTLAATAMVALGVGTLAGCALLAPVERFSDSATVQEEIRTIELEDPKGNVTIRGVDAADDVSIERTVSYRGDRPDGETHAVDGDTLVLGGCGRGCSVEYTIELPAGVDVRGSNSNGAIEVSGVGEVEAQTSNGRIELEEIAGGIDVETSNGRIIGRDLNGDGVRASTSNGPIELELGEPQDVAASTSNGSIELTVPAAGYRVSTETSNGRTDVEVPNDSAGEFSLDLRTSNGSITVAER
ncbi:DUF4097 domain-containing protein [Agromyces sp. NPDC058484]|uniref:DUF4097 family beta strand repeat-containing protein n=1 Tax=Agromyces sp. NPDC058484 TaxID=3346524 RepID=UPI00365F65EC